jgi:hypothetical protein
MERSGHGGKGGAGCYPTGMIKKKGFESDFVQFVTIFTVEDVRGSLSVLIASMFDAGIVSVDVVNARFFFLHRAQMGCHSAKSFVKNAVSCF